MKSTLRMARKGAYVIQCSELNGLRKIVEKRVGNATFEAHCTDEVLRVFDSWEELESYENASSKQIVRLTLNANSSDYSKSAEIGFSPRFGHAIEVTIRCDEDEMPILKEQIVDILEGMKQRILSYVVRINLMIATIVLVSLLSILWFIAIALSGSSGLPTDVDASTFLVRVIVAFYIGMLTGALAYGVDKLRDRILPRVHFALGQGASRYESWKSRWQITLVGVGVVIAVVGTVATVTIR